MSQTKRSTKSSEEKLRDLRVKEKLIVEWQLFPCLCNKSDPNFKKKEVKGKAYKDIAKAVGCTVDDAKTKLKNLRESFAKEKRFREKDALSGSGATTRTHFIFYEQLVFLLPHVRTRKSKSLMESDDEDGDDDGGEMEETQPDSDEEAEDDPEEDMSGGSFRERAVRSIFPASPQAAASVSSGSPQKSPQKTPQKSRKSQDSPKKTPETTPRKSQNTHCGTSSQNRESGPSSKKLKMSQASLAIPILSPPKAKSATHEARSKSKKESDMNSAIHQMVGVLQKSMETPKGPTSQTLLAQSIEETLDGILDEKVRKRWILKFRRLLNECEEEMLDD